MIATRLAGLLNVGGVLAVALMIVPQSPANGEEMLFDRELPAEHLNNVPGQARSNVRFGGITLVEIVQNLNEAGFLTGEAYHRVLREVEQGVIEVRSRLLHLVEAQSRPKLEEEGIIIRLPRIVIYAEDNGGLREEDIQAWIEQFEELGFPASSLPNFQTAEQTQEILDRLNETGVLSERAYTALQNAVATISVHVESQLYHNAAIQMRLDEALDPELVKPQLEQWREANILSDSGYAALMQALKDAALDKPIEFLRYLDKALLFDRQAYPLDAEIYYPDIYQTVAQKLSQTGVLDSEFGTFELEFVLRAEYEQMTDHTPASSDMVHSAPKVYDAVISAQVNGRNYQQASYYGKLDDKQDAVASISSTGIINFFNKILRDQASPYRLYSVSDLYGLLYGLQDHHRFGVIALTESQARIYFGDRYEADYEKTLTSDRVEEIVALFKEIGLLDHLNEAEIAEGRTRIARDYITEPHQLLTAFKDVVMFFDWESGNIDNPYQALTKELAAISHGHFNPTDISNGYDWENESASQSFTLNGTQYSIELEFNCDWLDPKFFEFIDAATAAEVSQGQFYPLSDGYDTVGYIFLSETQFEALRSQQLITLPAEEN